MKNFTVKVNVHNSFAEIQAIAMKVVTPANIS